MRELARPGLSPPDQKDLLASPSNAAETRARYFPADPPTYVDRVRRFLMHTFFPQMFPLQPLVDPRRPPRTPISEPVLADCALGIVAFGWDLPSCG